jgi:glycosyltransferase involved in cell wall biosynthesis
MRISVITVSYNSASTIERTLESVRLQSWTDVEHIAIDGASTDGTVDALVRHRADLAYFVSEPDGGIYDAMNKGIRASSGDVIGFLNADDHYAHDRVLATVAGVFQHDDVDAVFGDVVFLQPGGNGDRRVRRFRSGRFSPARIGQGWMPAHTATFVRRDVFTRFGEFRTDYRIGGDFEWVARAFGRGRIRYRHVPEVLVNMAMGGISTAGWRSTLLLNREFLRACRENEIRSSWPRLLSRYPMKVLEFIQRT